MTLLKQTTTGADDSFSKLEASDVEVDCSANSLNSDKLLRGMQTLTITQQFKPPDEEKSHESFPSLDATKTESGSMQDSGMVSAVTQYQSIGDECLRAGNESEVSGVNANDRECPQWGANRQQVYWEELFEEYPDKDGDTVLHLAVLQAVKHLADFVRMLQLQGQINFPNRLFQTPLHLAVLTAQQDAVQPLLSLGASLSAQDCHGNTPLHTACERHDSDMLKVLLDMEAIMEREGNVGNDENEERWEERKRREEEVAEALSARNYDGLTCLHIAVLKRSPDIVGLLLERGADVNAKDGKSGRSALHFAVENSPSSCHRVLLQLLQHPSLHINAATFAHQTALQLARGRNRLDLVHLLHEHGAEWSDSVGDFSSDSFSEDDAMEDETHVPYDDIRVAGQPLVHTRWR